MTSIITKIRDLIQDTLDSTPNESYTYYTDNVFVLSEPNAVSASIKVYVNGTLKASSNYTFDSSTNSLTYTGTLSSGNIVRITYSCYKKYSDTELQSYIRGALTYLAINKYKVFKAGSDNIVFPTPIEAEEQLIAIIASLNINGDIGSYRTPEMTINFNEKDSKDKRIRKVIRQFKKTYGILDYIYVADKVVETDEGMIL